MDKAALISVLGQFGEADAIAEVIHDVLPLREPLPARRRVERAKIGVRGMKMYVEVGFYEDGRPGEVFLKCGKQGTDVRDMFDGIAIMLSIALQHGIPLDAFPVRGRGNDLTGEGNELLDTIFETVEELCHEKVRGSGDAVPSTTAFGDQPAPHGEAGDPPPAPHP